tara:strand:+ start:2855 stop:3001 length:147 start_codon:yes stop_codon:yes gene_type:complete
MIYFDFSHDAMVQYSGKVTKKADIGADKAKEVGLSALANSLILAACFT